MECDDVLVAVGQENAFPWIERDIGIEFDRWDMPKVDASPCSRPIRKCFSAATPRSGRRTSSGPSPTAMKPPSRSTCLQWRGCGKRLPPLVNLMSQKMGIHEWSYDNDVSLDLRYKVPHAPKERR